MANTNASYAHSTDFDINKPLVVVVIMSMANYNASDILSIGFEINKSLAVSWNALQGMIKG